MVQKDNWAKHRKIALISLAVLTIILYALGMNHFSFAHKKKTSPKSKDESTVFQRKTESNKIWNLSKIFNTLTTQPQDGTVLKVHSMDELSAIFQDLNYNLKHVRCGASDVPSIFLEKLPQDMGDTQDISTKKEMFIKALLPMVLKANEKIKDKRQKLLQLEQKPSLTNQEQEWLQNLAEEYNLKSIDMKELKKRVDVIPPSLFLGQAALETEWGTSYAALVKKSLFGVTLKSGVKAYDSLQESVEGYVHNLNYNYAYKEMRDEREKMRTNGQNLCSLGLIGKLIKYSEQRRLYIKKVRTIISQNALKQLDGSRLRDV